MRLMHELMQSGAFLFRSAWLTAGSTLDDH